MQPVFTRPLRQIFLMLAVMTAVVAGAWLILGQLVTVFASNPLMNGAIIAVFALGVVSAFLQVWRLDRSVQWIGGFVNGAGVAHLATAPTLLAPLAALLGKRGPNGGQIAASSAHSILESVDTRMEESRDVVSYLGNLLIFLGLLGTFYGLATTVPALVETIRALAPEEGTSGAQMFDRLMNGLEGQLGGMGTAFSSSLLGLAGSLVIGLLELFASHGQNRFYRELEEWLSSITRLGLSAGEGEGGLAPATVALIDHLAAQVETLQSLQAEAGAGSAMAAQNMGQLARAIESLSSQSAAEAGQTAALTRIAEGQERLVAALNAVETGAHVDAESRMRLRSIDVQLLRILEEISAGRQESLSDLRHDMAILTQAVRQQIRPREG